MIEAIDQPTRRPALSIVTTMYQSAPYVEEFHARATAAARAITDRYEIVFVNDGSPDDSLSIARSLFDRDEHVRVVDLSRNFGHHKAMMTGLMHASGERVLLIDCDLEEEPELLDVFMRKMEETDADVVYGVQAQRRGGGFDRWAGEMFYAFFNLMATIDAPRNVVTARLMRRAYVESLIQHRDREVFMLGLWVTTGFKQVAVEITKHSKGKTTYNLFRKISVVVNSITSFSNRPLVYIFYLGTIISLVAGVFALNIVLRRLLFGEMLQGWLSLIVSMWLLGGLTIFSIGIIGIYLSKVFTEVKDRPYTIVKAIYEHDASGTLPRTGETGERGLAAPRERIKLPTSSL